MIGAALGLWVFLGLKGIDGMPTHDQACVVLVFGDFLDHGIGALCDSDALNNGPQEWERVEGSLRSATTQKGTDACALLCIDEIVFATWVENCS